MFGQQPATSPFGNPSGGGSSLFGAPAATPAFGSPTPAPAFGAPATGTPGGFGFGTPAAAPSTGFGGFGATPAPAPSAFGAFGSPAPAPTAFGAPSTSTPFGTSAAPSGGLFGSNTPATNTASGGLFGGGNTSTGFGSTLAAPATSAFGAPAPTSAFGAPAPTTSTFGATSAFGSAPAPATGGLFGSAVQAPTSAFGAPAPAASAFGTPASTGGGLFGSTTPAAAPTGGMFGAPAVGAKAGTLQVQYADTRTNDGNSGPLLTFKSISAMTQYKDKSFEEWRIDDYMAGNKGQASGQQSAFGAPMAAATSAFGAPAPAGGLFGAAPAPATSAFGAPAAPSGGLFGSAAAAPATSAFGAPATNTFGASPAPSAGFSFGSAAPAPAVGAFGAPAPAPAGGGLFGAPAPATGGLFGAPAPAAGGLFGAPAPAPAAGGLFGAPAPAPATGGLFGAPAPAPVAGGLFGATSPAPVAGGLFGAPAPAAGGLFGAPAPAPAAGGFFGSTAAPAASSYGAPAAPLGMGVAAGTTVLVPPSSDALLMQQLAAVEAQNKELKLAEALRGSSPNNKMTSSSSGSSIPTSIFQRDAAAVRYRGLAGGGGISSSPYPQQNGIRSAVKIRPRGFASLAPSSAPRVTNGARYSGGGGSKVMTPSAFIGSATKQLVLKPGALTQRPMTRLLLCEEPTTEKKQSLTLNGNNGGGDTTTQSPLNVRYTENGDAETPASLKDPALSLSGHHKDNDSPYVVSRIANNNASFLSPDASSQVHQSTEMEQTPVSTSAKSKDGHPVNDEAYDYYRTVIGSPISEIKASNGNGVTQMKSLAPKLTKDGYVVTPSINTLNEMSESELASVSNFVVEKIGIGSVAWDGTVDVRGIDLDTLVSIEPKDISVYHEEEKAGTKPPEGTKLNRPAVLTFHDIFPRNGASASAEAKEKFERKIEKSTKSMGSELIMYDVNSGIWMCRVPHFSRYGLVNDDSDDEIGENKTNSSDKMDFDSGVSGGLTPEESLGMVKRGSKGAATGYSRIRAPLNEDDEMMEEESLELTSEVGEDQVLQAADAAYAKMSELGSALWQTENMNILEQKSLYSDEGETKSAYSMPLPIAMSSQKRNFSVCSEIANRVGIRRKTSSSTDFSMRFGRSFRVGWRPDGSFLAPTRINGDKNDQIIQSRPISLSKDVSLSLLSTHLNHSVNICPNGEVGIFILPSGPNEESGTESTLSVLNILSEYQQFCECDVDGINDMVSQAFSLISSLSGDETSNQNQKFQAFSKWMQKLCVKGVDKDVLSANNANSRFAAIFAALSGGDIAKASLIARETGLLTLSIMITNSDFQARRDLSEQMQSWANCCASQFTPPHLERIYSLMSGDLTVEESLYENSGPTYEHALDWKRRLALLVKSTDCNSIVSSDSMISSILNTFDSCVESGKVPPANAWYIASKHPESIGVTSSEKCILYRLMKLFTDTEDFVGGKKLSDIISPLGHTPASHDVTFSFHLASVLSVLRLRCQPLSESEELRLLESYADDLVRDGHWEWAIYVVLCSFNEDSLTKRLIQRKKTKAMEILFKNYLDNSSSKQRRDFLETNIGIPSYWFKIAVSYRSIQSLHYNTFTHHSAEASMSNTLVTFEEMVLPSILFDLDKDNCHDLMLYLETMRNELGDMSSSSFGGLVLQYLKLSEIVIQSSAGTVMEEQWNFDELLEQAFLIQNAIPKLEKPTGRGDDLSKVPRNVAITELEDAVMLLIAQLKVLQTGRSVVETNGKNYDNSELRALKIMSKLGYLMLDQPEASQASFDQIRSSSILRGKCGIEIEI